MPGVDPNMCSIVEAGCDTYVPRVVAAGVPRVLAAGGGGRHLDSAAVNLLDAFLLVLHLGSCFALIVLILLHAGRGGGLSDMFGGMGGGASLAGSTVVEKNLDRLTVVVALVFAITTIALGLSLS